MRNRQINKILLIVINILFSQTFADVSSGLEVHLTFDESSGTIATDASGNNNNGSVQGNPQWISGHKGNALSFDEVNDQVVIPDFDYTSGGTFSVSFWFKADNNSGSLYQYMFSHGAVSSANSFNLYLFEEGNSTAPRLRSNIRDGSNTPGNLDADVDYADNVWHLYTLTVTSNQVLVYVDGVLQSTSSSGGGSFSPSTDIYIGGRSDENADRFFGGQIDDFRIYNRVLSPADISELYGISIIFQEDFNADEIDFVYNDDQFRATNQPSYAAGSHVTTGGFNNTGAIQVTLGAAPSGSSVASSGAWSNTIHLTQSSNVLVSFMYNLTQSPEYESNEFSEALLSVDGVLHGTSPNDYIHRITGDGNGGSDISTGWQSVTINLGMLTSGTHTFSLGAYNNQSTYTNETTTILLDNVSISISGEEMPGSRTTDSLALVALQNAIDGLDWPLYQSMNTWHSIRVENDRVVHLSLSGDESPLSGTIPAEIGNLSELKYLTIQFLDHEGRGFTNEVFDLRKLEVLNLNYCNIGGQIPGKIDNLVDLTRLNLDHNNLIDPIPSSIGNLTQLTRLGLHNNLFTSIPSSIGSCVNIEGINLSYNNLTTLPIEITNLTHITIYSSLAENKLCALSQPIIAWANATDPEWASSQDCPEPSVEISANPISGAAPLTVDFSAVNTGSSNIDTWQWNFGDGGTSTLQNPTHTFTSGGEFTVQLTANGIGGSVVENMTITVSAPSPIVSISATPTFGQAPLSVAFNATVIENGPITSWTWAFGNDDYSSEQNPSYTYLVHGTYNVTLQAAGPNGSTTKSMTVEVSPAKPNVSILASPQTGEAPLHVFFEGVSSDGGPVTTWSWNYGDNVNSTGKNVQHVYDFAGNYTVHLYASGPGGSDTAMTVISVTGFSERQVDSLVLVSLYNNTDGDHWYNNTNWLSQSPLDSWYGVAMLDNRIDRLKLDSNNLSGTFPSDLNDWNRIRYISLSKNNLSGEIPMAFGGLYGLEYVDFSQNNISGSIPSTTINLTDLDTIIMSENFLSGDISDVLYNLQGAQIINLGKNQIAGSLNSQIGNYTTLTELILHGNSITGSIPLEIRSLVNLQSLVLNNNQLSGSIPASLMDLGELSILNLSSNEFTGAIPPEFGNLHNLLNLNLCNNQLSGAIPIEFGNLNLESLILNNNQLTGALPNVLGNVRELRYLNISRNEFAGDVPLEFEQLYNLVRLSINNNQLTTLPEEIRMLDGLESLDIGFNQFCNLNPLVEEWANQNDPDWASTQTCADPEISLSANPQSGAAPLVVDFAAQDIGQTNIVDWQWDFGDGGTSTEQNPPYTYTNAGTFWAKVSATGAGSTSARDSVLITVTNPPNVNISVSPSAGNAPLIVTVSVANSGGPVDTWSWDFGNGTTSSEQNPPPQTFSIPGNYIIELTATNASGSSTDTAHLHVHESTTANLTMGVSGQGSVSPPVGVTIVTVQEEVAIVATAASGFVFSHWGVITGDATILEPSLPSTAVVCHSDATIQAVFIPELFTLTVNSSAHGTTSPIGDTLVNPSEPVTIIAIPDSGYAFDKWLINSGVGVIADPYNDTTSIEVSSQNTVITATFVPISTEIPFNRMISIAGVLEDEHGDVIGMTEPDTIDMSIRLVTEADSGDTLYTETFYYMDGQGVIVDEGNFVVRLGQGNSVDDIRSVISQQDKLFVEITIEGATPDVLHPRLPLTASPYALSVTGTTSDQQNVIHGMGDPVTNNVPGAIGMLYVNDEDNTTWMRLQSGWHLMD